MKRWRIYPPGATAEGAAFSQTPALRYFNRSAGHDHQPTEEAAPFEFVQRSGECVVLPRNYAHATLNLANSVAFALEWSAVF